MSSNTKSPFKDNSYLTEATYEEYARLLKITPRAFSEVFVGIMDIVHVGENPLVLFHYHPDKIKHISDPKYGFSSDEMSEISKIRGIVVAVNEMKIVCKSSRYTMSYVRNEVPTDGSFEMGDSSVDNYFSGTSKENYYKEWVYGALVRVFTYKGTVYISSHKKISCTETFFGNSRKFTEILFAEQDVFKTPESFFSGETSESDFVHFFILADPELSAGTSANVSQSNVYYIGSLDLSDPTNDVSTVVETYIKENNADSSRPILFPKTLTPEEVNFRLTLGNPSAFRFMPNNTELDNKAQLNSMAREDALRIYENCERVIMYNQHGVFTVMSHQAYYRTSLLDGKCNIENLFSILVSYIERPDLNRRRIVCDYGFTYDQLMSMKDDIIAGKTIDFSNYQDESPSIYDVILTNLVFSVPKQFVESCFTAYTQFVEKIISTYEFLWEIKDELMRAIRNQGTTLDEFPGLGNKKVILKRYFSSDFVPCFYTRSKYASQKTLNDIIGSGPDSKWVPQITNIFNSNKEMGKQKGKSNKTVEFLQKNAVLCFIVKAPGDALYSLLNFKQKYYAAVKAFEKRDAKQMDEYMNGPQSHINV